MITKLRKSRWFCHLRQFLPMREPEFTNDFSAIQDSPPVHIRWPETIKKPHVGIVQDFGKYPGWTKYALFLKVNGFPYGLFSIHNHDWLEQAAQFDVIVGNTSNAQFHLDEMREKYYVLETHLHKICYPSMKHMFLFEDKKLEAYLSKIYHLPFVNTYISYEKENALSLAENLRYPLVSKIIPSSGSVGTELVHSKRQAKKIIREAFSIVGRRTHVVYFRQKNYVYFQDFIPNAGYDIRVVVVGNRVFGFYRKAPKGDFRASGFHLEEMRALPEEAMRIARQVNRVIKSPQLVVDMIFGLDGRYYINEFSPLCQMSTLYQLQVNGEPGAYVFADDDTYHFEPGCYWVHELALREFFLNDYLPRFSNGGRKEEVHSISGMP